MPIESVFISRISDGLVLAASGSDSTTSSTAAFRNNVSSATLRSRTTAATPASSHEAQDILVQLNTSSTPRCSVDGNMYTYHYSITSPIVVLVATDRSYPKKLAFVYLEEVRRLFTAFIEREHAGTDFQRVIASTDRPYAFIRFDRELKNLKREFADPSSKHNMQRLQENLAEIQTIMRRNIDDLMKRGDTLNDIKSQSQRLKDDSKSLAFGARKLNHMAMLRKYGPFVGAGFLVLFFLWIRFYVMP